MCRKDSILNLLKGWCRLCRIIRYWNIFSEEMKIIAAADGNSCSHSTVLSLKIKVTIADLNLKLLLTS